MDKYHSIISKDPQETSAMGEKIATSLKREGKSSNVICLYGELGSGKTTFVQGFARGLGISARLLSPTYIIVRRYSIPNVSGFLYHMDLYRLLPSVALSDLGIQEILQDKESYVVIEWAEKLGDLLPDKRT